ncbi:hypothetical protein AMS68_007560 [Peltaster fructicola]|uniref:Transcription elongation factor SPT4 n=1 Tax=Peltaster fructicola TaxID=286661 RepID=A0A6H0Y4W4_9PEZI|nr:hypothetical protein AMS68_007560 [Peltaster fructicola]
MVCAIVQPTSQFTKNGCPNCEPFLEMRGNPDTVQETTSQVFEGLISMAEPGASWVAKWQRIQGYVPGLYAVKVVGQLPEDYAAAAANAGVQYVPRDGTSQDEL